MPDSFLVTSSFIRPPITRVSPLLILAVVSIVLVLTWGTVLLREVPSAPVEGSEMVPETTDNSGKTFKVISRLSKSIEGVILKDAPTGTSFLVALITVLILLPPLPEPTAVLVLDVTVKYVMKLNLLLKRPGS